MILKNISLLFLAFLALLLTASCESSTSATGSPPKPQIPQNFQWEGRWIVKDLDIDVPFTWYGKDGMVEK